VVVAVGAVTLPVAPVDPADILIGLLMFAPVILELPIAHLVELLKENG
jgi:hypothetical protein